MAEILSQSQIDALLNSVRDNSFEETKENSPGDKKYRKYDFYSPKKFTKDRLKMIKSVYESYGRIVSSRLNSLLRVSSEVEVVAVEEQRYYEFSNALDEHDVLTLIRTEIPDTPENSLIILQTTNQLTLSMIDRMIGGLGEDMEVVPTSYTYTDIELSLYENLIKYIIGVMKDGWSNYLELEFDFARLEVNPGLMQEIGMDETIVIIVIDVSFSNVKGKINICIPGSLLSNIFDVFDTRKLIASKASSHDEGAAEEILGSLKHSTLEIKAQLAKSQILLSDVYRLHIGDVINLNESKDSDVYLYIEDKPWFKGKLGVHNKNMAVKISEMCENS